MEVLFEAPHLPARRLPAELRRVYGGDLGFDEPALYANFVSSLDGVVALDSPEPAGPIISGGSEADRFTMGLLRAFADAVLVGGGTLRAEREHLWTPEHIYPPASAQYALLRRELGRRAGPQTVVLTAGGDLDIRAAALEAGALIVSTDVGRSALEDKLPSASRVVTLGDREGLKPAAVLDLLRSVGFRLILAEGGPHLIGSLAAMDLIDELFLTISPVLAGRDASHRRMGLVEGALLLPSRGRWGSLVSVRRADSPLFVRWVLRDAAGEYKD